MLAVRHAKELQVPVIVWRFRAKGLLVDKLNSIGRLDDLYTLDSGLVGIFLKGAPVQITENIDPDMDVVNGSIGRLHSFVYPDSISENDRRMHDLSISNASPGDIVWLPFPIETLNFEYTSASEKLKNRWPEAAAFPDENELGGNLIIPVGLLSGHKKKEPSIHSVVIDGVVLSGDVRPIKNRLELLYLVTLHKCQGDYKSI